jgi:HD-GYP domain-containing protein (c-di-GMP phosphodiesterase class II)
MSLATDVGFGQPLESGLRVCVLAMGLAGELGLEGALTSRIFYLSLLRHIGCTAAADEVAAIAGDEIALREGTARLDLNDSMNMVPYMLRHVASTVPGMARPGTFLRLAMGAQTIKGTTAVVCEVADMLGRRMGLDEDVRRAVGAAYERWDGKGLPGLLKGDGVPVPV